MTSEPDLSPSDDETALREFVWRAQEIGLVPPPVPLSYQSQLQSDWGSDSLWTDRSLLDYLGRFRLVERLMAGQWPKTGMAFRFSSAGRWAYWQCLMVGRLSLILVDLRVPLGDDGSAPLAPLNVANRRLEAILTDEVTLSHYLSEGATGPQEVGQVTLYANPSGYGPVESQFRFSAAQGLSAIETMDPLFGRAPQRSAAPDEIMILRL